MYTIIDTHVHLYDGAYLFDFISRLNQNFNSICNDKKVAVTQKVILLTEGFYDTGFDNLLSFLEKDNELNRDKVQEYQVVDTDHHSFVHTEIDNGELIFVAGRQIVSSDNLELLFLGSDSIFNPANKTTEELIVEIAGNGTVLIIPWGVGKWLGKRGRIVSQLLQNSNLPPFFIGDSANRPLFWPEPSQFRIARENGIKNLPGSDPLPVKNGYKNAGKAGILLKDSIHFDDPVHSLKSKLLDPSTHIQPYMKKENPLSFFRNQFVMQYKKYFGYENRQKS